MANRPSSPHRPKISRKPAKVVQPYKAKMHWHTFVRGLHIKFVDVQAILIDVVLVIWLVTDVVTVLNGRKWM